MMTGPPPTRRRSWRDGLLRPAVGLVSIFALLVIVALALALFQGGFTSSVAVTVISQRAGLVMYPDARVKLRGVEVGRVSSIEERADGTAAIHLAMDPKQLDSIPGNTRVAVVASTAFGAKFVQLVEPPIPSQERMRAGQVIEAEHVTVEINNVFDRLSTVLSTVEPGKLNATLGALSSAMSGRGRQIKQTIKSLDSFLARLEPSLPTLSRDLQDAPGVLNTFADAAPNLLDALSAANTTSTTLVDKQEDLDSLLTSVIGLAEIGTEVVGANRQPLTDLLRLLTPITSLTNEYNQALYCGVAGILPIAKQTPSNVPGIEVLAGFLWGAERYRYPGNLPKIAASGPPSAPISPGSPTWVVHHMSSPTSERSRGPTTTRVSCSTRTASSSYCSARLTVRHATPRRQASRDDRAPWSSTEIRCIRDRDGDVDRRTLHRVRTRPRQ